MSILSFENVSKSFFGVKAVDDVSFDLEKGRLLGLVGENGAGKSTLMNLLGGVLPPDEGRIRVDGKLYAPRSPRDARSAGIAFIHQELNLFTNLSVAENLFIDDYPRVAGLPILNGRAMRRRAKEALEAVALDVPPSTRVDTLTPGERQLVEIAKAVGALARIIIFDEPTTSLTNRETERLFGMLGRLREGGTTLLYISHILPDILRLADEVMVMRDGVLVEKDVRDAFDTRRMISLMVGRDIERLYPARDDARNEGRGGETVLEAVGLSQSGVVHDITFDLKAGEVLGLFGLMGAGRSELARILFGLDPFERGTLKVGGRAVDAPSPRRAIELGLAFVTEDRREEGLMMNASIAENMSLVTVSEYADGPLNLLNKKRLGERVRRVGDDLKLKASGYEQPVKTLSGGNQQKVVLGKWLDAEPRVFIIDEPTRGVDVGAKFEVYTLVHALARDGAGILFISSELEELLGVCDRLLVMRNGELTAEFGREDFDQERVLAAAFGEAADGETGREGATHEETVHGETL